LINWHSKFLEIPTMSSNARLRLWLFKSHRVARQDAKYYASPMGGYCSKLSPAILRKIETDMCVCYQIDWSKLIRVWISRRMWPSLATTAAWEIMLWLWLYFRQIYSVPVTGI